MQWCWSLCKNHFTCCDFSEWLFMTVTHSSALSLCAHNDRIHKLPLLMSPWRKSQNRLRWWNMLTVCAHKLFIIWTICKCSIMEGEKRCEGWSKNQFENRMNVIWSIRRLFSEVIDNFFMVIIFMEWEWMYSED